MVHSPAFIFSIVYSFGFGFSLCFAWCRFASFKLFWPPALIQQALVAIISQASHRLSRHGAFACSPPVVAFVRMQLVRPAAEPAAFSAHCRQGVDQIFEDYRIMAIGPGDAKDQRSALAVCDEVALASEFSSVGGVWACQRARPGVGTLTDLFGPL
jgi:hypothetical protein